MSEKRKATKADERELKTKLSFFIVILMVLSLTVCNRPKTQEQQEEQSAPTPAGMSAVRGNSGVLPEAGPHIYTAAKIELPDEEG